MNKNLYLICILFFNSIQSETIVEKDELSISSFNIQKFSYKKAQNEEVMKNIVKILSSFDISCVQEITDVNEKAPHILLDRLNNYTGDQYMMALSPRTGRSNNKEQYACFYNKSRVTVTNSYLYDDSLYNEFERDPFLVEFEANNFKFLAIVCHIKPADVEAELNSLPWIIDTAIENSGLDNVIIMGDFNADCTYLSNLKLKSSPLYYEEKYIWLINSSADTTTGPTDCAYDRILIRGDKMMEYYSNKSGVYRFDVVLNLTSEETRAISDHYPVQFTISLPQVPEMYCLFKLSRSGYKLLGVFKAVK